MCYIRICNIIQNMFLKWSDDVKIIGKHNLERALHFCRTQYLSPHLWLQLCQYIGCCYDKDLRQLSQNHFSLHTIYHMVEHFIFLIHHDHTTFTWIGSLLAMELKPVQPMHIQKITNTCILGRLNIWGGYILLVKFSILSYSKSVG